MEYAIVYGKYRPKDPGLGPDTAGIDRSGLPFSCTGAVHCCADGRSIGTQDRDDGEDADNDALGPVNEYDLARVPVSGNCQYDGDEVGRQEYDDRRGEVKFPGENTGQASRDLHTVLHC